MTSGNGSLPPTATINLRVLAAVSLFAAKKDETRYYLNGVCIEIDARGVTYIGTDGHRMMAYRDDLLDDDDDNRLVGTFIIPIAHCKAHKVAKDDDGRAKVFHHHGDEGRLTIAYNFVDLTFLPIDGVYPHWRRVVPQKPASGVIAQFNLKYLADLHKFARALELGDPFIAPNGEGPALVWFSGLDHVMGVVMPIKLIDEINHEIPQWARGAGPEREQSDFEDFELEAAEPSHDPETGEIPPEKPIPDHRPQA